MNEELMKAVKDFRDILDRQDAEIKSHGTASQETKEMLGKLQDKIDELETKMKRPPLPGGGSETSAEEQKAREEMMSYMRKGIVGPDLQKAMSSDSGPDGGYLVPSVMANRIIALVREMSPIRQIASVETISTGSALEIPRESETDFDAGWVGERQSRDETTSGKLEMAKIPVAEMYAKPKITQGLLDDPAFNFENFITERIARRFARLEGTGFVTGNGINKPLGLLADSAIETLATAAAGVVTFDDLIALQYLLKEEYANAGQWLMKRTTVRTVRQLKDGQGQYLWQPSTQVGQPPTLLGAPLHQAVDFPAIATGAKAIAFGDFRRGYQIVDKGAIKTLRDPYSAKPFVEFYTTKNVGGQVVLPEAIKILTIQ